MVENNAQRYDWGEHGMVMSDIGAYVDDEEYDALWAEIIRLRSIIREIRDRADI